MSKRPHTIKSNTGMTVVELMVVLAIFLIVAGTTIFDYSRFRSNVSLQNLADDVALSIRRAQNYAIGVHSSQSSIFSTGYGIHFSTSSSSSPARAGYNKSFIIFNDLDGDEFYDYTSLSSACSTATLGNSGNECIDILNITSGDKIYQICPNQANCAAGYTDITFLRPNPDANICTGDLAGSCIPRSSVDIKIRNDQTGNLKTITVSSTGQISIQ